MLLRQAYHALAASLLSLAAGRCCPSHPPAGLKPAWVSGSPCSKCGKIRWRRHMESTLRREAEGKLLSSSSCLLSTFLVHHEHSAGGHLGWHVSAFQVSIRFLTVHRQLLVILGMLLWACRPFWALSAVLFHLCICVLRLGVEGAHIHCCASSAIYGGLPVARTYSAGI